MIDISRLSKQFDVRKLGDSDVDIILELCRENTQYYQYCGAETSKEQILEDLHSIPPGIGKYYICFFRKSILIAVMDLIDGYPEPDVAYVGFFMMKKEEQGRQIGSTIIQETAAYLKETGKTAIQLGIDQENPQSTYFWKKNGFHVIREVDLDGWTALVAEKKL